MPGLSPTAARGEEGGREGERRRRWRAEGRRGAGSASRGAPAACDAVGAARVGEVAPRALEVEAHDVVPATACRDEMRTGAAAAAAAGPFDARSTLAHVHAVEVRRRVRDGDGADGGAVAERERQQHVAHAEAARRRDDEPRVHLEVEVAAAHRHVDPLGHRRRAVVVRAPRPAERGGERVALAEEGRRLRVVHILRVRRAVQLEGRWRQRPLREDHLDRRVPLLQAVELRVERERQRVRTLLRRRARDDVARLAGLVLEVRLLRDLHVGPQLDERPVAEAERVLRLDAGHQRGERDAALQLRAAAGKLAVVVRLAAVALAVRERDLRVRVQAFDGSDFCAVTCHCSSSMSLCYLIEQQRRRVGCQINRKDQGAQRGKLRQKRVEVPSWRVAMRRRAQAGAWMHG